MIAVLLENGKLIVQSGEGDFAPRNESQLIFWGFKTGSKRNQFQITSEDNDELLVKVLGYFERCQLRCEVDTKVQNILDRQCSRKEQIQTSQNSGRLYKVEGKLPSEAHSFSKFLSEKIPRKLRDHQLKAALHLITVKNGANFSVPGSGKTTVLLSVFQWLRTQYLIDALFVVGPPACFGPWKDEYELVLGEKPRYEILAGGDIDVRHSKYLVNRESVRDLYLTTFQTLQRDFEQVCSLFKHQGLRFFLVVDEAHYIKQLDGIWATAALKIARFAERRCILTGTPFPKSYQDAFNLFDVLWPETSAISAQDKYLIEFHSQKNQLDKAAEILNKSVEPLFYRVRKKELGLAQQVFHEPLQIRMNRYERQIYDQIVDKILEVAESDYLRDLDLLTKLRRGRMMRLRQCLSYTALLQTAIDEYDEDICEPDLSATGIIGNYDELELPAKIEALSVLVNELQEKREKVVIWANFVATLKLIKEKLLELGYKAELIYGGTPSESANVQDELTREGIIRQFVARDSGLDILIANPAACAESISLHKTCSHAIYYDLSYNCAQYLQSLDRIHRVGGSEEKVSHYHFLHYEDTLDPDILDNVKGKAERMSQIIDQDYPIYSLDMFAEDDELEAYERLFGC